ncbi:hypothetical protein JR316_0011257 [Psilocybe cubensis]|nr:hypothetical protein JR316_0011257 [Psilocybe cubensis]KAH9475698.1 hypothetical protein JR316_0011257 [Psilocybe cubensis]
MEADEEIQFQLFHAACTEHMRSEASLDVDDLNRAISLYCFALSKIPQSSTLHRQGLFNLSCALEDRFRKNGLLEDLDKSIAVGRGARNLVPTNDSNQHIFLDNLAAQLQTRFKHTEQLRDIDECIALRRDVLEMSHLPADRRHIFLRRLARALESRFEVERDIENLEEAISQYRMSVDLITTESDSHPDLSNAVRCLADALVDLYGETSEQRHLNEAISLFRRSILCAGDAEEKYEPLHNLAHALKTRFDCMGLPEDLRECIDMHRQVFNSLPQSHPDRPIYTINLANAIMARYDLSGQEADLHSSIAMYQEAVDLERAQPTGTAGSNEHMAINNLATALVYRFELNGERGDLEQSIALHKDNLARMPSRDPRRAEYLTNLANSLNALSRQTGDRATMDQAILTYREAFELFTPLHPMRSRFVNNLAQTLLLRYEQTGFENDYEEAVTLLREALQRHSGSHPSRGYSLINLANALGAKTHTKSKEATRGRLEEAISLCREALNLSDSGRSNNATILNSLSGTLLDQYKLDNEQEYLIEAVQRYREAVDLLPLPSPLQPMYLSNLGHALHCLFKTSREKDHFIEAASLHKKALELYPPFHYHRYVSLMDLANLLVLAYLRTEEVVYLDSAMLSFKAASQNASHSAFTAHNIADTWSYHADALGHTSALEAYEVALRSLSQMASLSLDIYSRQDTIQTSRSGLASKAAWCAIKVENFNQAVEFLEGGRAIFWAQALHLRTSFDRLQEKSPVLAQRLQQLAGELEHASYRNSVSADPAMDNKSKMSLEAQEAQFRKLDDEWSKGINEVRNIPGFEDFLQSPRIESLRRAASDCPIIFLVPGQDVSACLVMTAQTVHYICLDNLSEETLLSLVTITRLACGPTPDLRGEVDQFISVQEIWTDDMLEKSPALNRLRSKGAFGRRRTRPSSDSLFEYVLLTLWDDLVKPIIDALGFQKLQSPQRVKWCPSGPFSFLPIHAAGCYNLDQGSLQCTSDYLVSSYIPTVGLLLSSVTKKNTTSEGVPFQFLAVLDPELPSASIELHKIKKQAPSDCIIELGSTGGPGATIDTICSHLQTASIAHFACHGIQDPSSPLDSSLFVHDGKLSIVKIMQQSIPNGSLAFLCACETAMGDMAVPDESMSIGACMLFSGYRSVVATMWKIADEDGPTVADAFYAKLFESVDDKANPLMPDISQSAQALHNATLQLRLSGVGYRRWVPFVHLGN